MMNAATLISLIDATYLPDSLNTEKDEATIRSLLATASGSSYQVAAICIPPAYVAFTKDALASTNTLIPVATVANFPTGEDPVERVLVSIHESIQAGVDEMDLVMPYQKLLAGQFDEVKSFLVACQAALPEGIGLKVIIESGMLSPQMIKKATQMVCGLGADFVKTSTGKLKGKGASLAAVKLILEELLQYRKRGHSCGLKISGGVSIQNVDAYLALVRDMMGDDFIKSSSLRLGASALLNDVAGTL